MLGVDYGMRQVGLAITDDEGRLAFPHKVFTPQGALKAIQALVNSDKITKVIIGEPEDAREGDSILARRLYEFAGKVRVLTGASVIFEPEGYSTFEARRPQKDKRGKLSRPRRYETHHSGRADARAAAVILQRHIERSVRLNTNIQ